MGSTRILGECLQFSYPGAFAPQPSFPGPWANLPELLAGYIAKELKDDTVIVVLGASGDLAKKKTFPALFGLFRNKFLPKDIKIIGYARTKMDHAEFIKRVRSYIKVPTKEIEEQLASFCELCTYVAGQYDQDDSFIALNKHLEELEKGKTEQNRVFYMALPPSVFVPVSEHLKKNCYPKKGIARIIVEKPFGQRSREFARAGKERSSLTGEKTKFSVSITISEKRW
ncbi:glucose-6-phosphate 1-dehydrogenase [Coccidioides immitis RMSCC 3703]|uniref:glucose-6-phosphate dehydrogenase (NADP(+)) n=1 Tax=Coccidioides immitis RMSCC 3703 TaxID=454286 RepID=A0A0J8U1E5_COCIT|nr:glucose-6-phosphate 1-dehydrogenase [Coccidioides immitis RMSCC 3703]